MNTTAIPSHFSIASDTGAGGTSGAVWPQGAARHRSPCLHSVAVADPTSLSFR